MIWPAALNAAAVILLPPSVPMSRMPWLKSQMKMCVRLSAVPDMQTICPASFNASGLLYPPPRFPKSINGGRLASIADGVLNVSAMTTAKTPPRMVCNGVANGGNQFAYR